jgi:hypothetical protein
MKKLLIVTVAIAMIPLFMGMFCPCAMAAPADQPTLQRMACQGCCPEMNMSPECNSAVTQSQTLTSFTEPFKVLNTLKALSLGASPDIAINRRALVPAGDEPSPGFTQPLYLTLQVFRI